MTAALPARQRIVYLLPWVIGPLFIRLPESTVLLSTVIEQQFWFLAFCCTTFALCSLITHHAFVAKPKGSFWGMVRAIAAFLFIGTGFAVATEGVGSKLDERVTYCLLTFIPTLLLYLIAVRRGQRLTRVVTLFLWTLIAAEMSLVVYSGATSWPSWLVAASFALLLTACEAFRLDLLKTGSGCLALAPIPIAWLVSVQQLTTPYLAILFSYLLISRTLEAARRPEPDGRDLLRRCRICIAAFVAICLVARMF